MPRRRTHATRAPRGAQKWILNEFGSESPGKRLSTSQITRRIEKASRKSFHKNSVYKALRLLVNRRALSVIKSGREKLYQVLGSVRSTGTPAVSPAKPAASSAKPAAAIAAREARSGTPMLPHKLALGEILVLSVGARDVLTATNLHGRLALERHRLPA